MTTFALPVINNTAPKPFVAQCNRSGCCCETLPLDFSPRQLRDSYEAWFDNSGSDGRIVKLKEIFLIYPMLEGRCRGKIVQDGAVKYVYGPCKNLDFELVDGKRLAKCSIHENRPSLCRGYPYYSTEYSPRMSLELPVTNPGYMRGCGYNADSGAGRTREEIDADLLPLEPHEN